jgi:ADP-heptose:LPS heptosyltransferase
VLLAAPLVRALKHAYPEAQLDYLVESYSAAAARGIPGVDSTIEVPRKLSPSETLSLRKRLQHANYDLAVDVQSNQKTGIYTWFSGARKRIGFDQPWYKLHTRLFYTDMVPRNLTPTYTCHYRLDLLRPLGIESEDVSLAYRPPKNLVARARLALSSGVPAGTRWIGLSPGGRIPLKSWPLEHYAALGQRLIAQGFHILVIFGPGEQETANELQRQLGEQAHLEESSSYEQHAALLSCLAGVVLNDGGNLHLAVGLGVPSVTIFGPTDPRIWASPDQTRHRWLRGNCTCTPEGVHHCIPKKCLVAVSPRDVEANLLDLLETDG